MTATKKLRKHSKPPTRSALARPIGSALANRIADALMAGWQGFHAARLQLRGPDEQDMGGLCRDAIVRVIDKELDADALARSKPALMRKIKSILHTPNMN
jgi:hypothetical protein